MQKAPLIWLDRFETDSSADSERAEKNLERTLHGEEAGLDCGLADFGQRVVAVTQRGEDVAFDYAAGLDRKGFGDFESVEIRRLPIQIEAQRFQQRGNNAAAHLAQLFGYRILHPYRAAAADAGELFVIADSGERDGIDLGESGAEHYLASAAKELALTARCRI